MIDKLLKLLARDTKDKTRIDGTSHIIPQLIVQIASSVIIFAIYRNIEAVKIGNYITTAVMFLYWLVSEILQEHAMVKKDSTRTFKFSKNRIQDILIPTASGGVYSSLFHLIVRVIF